MSTASNTKPTQVLVATFITFFLLLLSKVKAYDDISFEYKKFKPNGKDLILQRNASISESGVLRLSKVVNGKPVSFSTGTARYDAPVHIWDKERVASFYTSFSFTMEAPNQKDVSDGMTFFLAPPDFQVRRGGGFFGLFADTKCQSSYRIVAVEFDTHGAPNNEWDPRYQHIGIDVNCVTSKKTVRWDARYKKQVANVEIRYQASTKMLTTTLTYPSDKKSYTVSAPVDLKAILPEWVRVGFSATTHKIFLETHDVLNWYFTSSLDGNINVALENNATRDTA